MKVLITGGTGTISGGLVKESILEGNETYSLTRGTNQSRNMKGAHFIYGDVFNEKEMAGILKERHFDVVVECLVYHIEQLKISLENFAKRCNQYIFISTAGIYNQQEKRISESAEKGQRDWGYTREKIKCEDYLITYCEKIGLKYTIIRPTVTYGDYRIPFPIATRTPGWTFFRRMLEGKPMLGGYNARYSVIHVDDFACAVVSLFGNDKAFNEDFHVSSNQGDINWDDTITEAGRILGVYPLVIHVPPEIFKRVYPAVYGELKYNKNRELLLDDTKIRNATNYEAKISLGEGIARTIDAMRKEYTATGCVLDERWDADCDATIFYAYKKSRLCEQEMAALEQYLAKGHYGEYKNSLDNIKRQKLRAVIGRTKNKLKKSGGDRWERVKEFSIDINEKER